MLMRAVMGALCANFSKRLDKRVQARRRFRLVGLTLCLIAFVIACDRSTVENTDERILVIGDSVLAFHRYVGGSVADHIQLLTGVGVVQNARHSARLSATSARMVAAGYDIRAQYVADHWSWVVMNGGANDLLAECGCRRCRDTLDQMISQDGLGGDIPALLTSIDAPVALVGYTMPPGLPLIVSRCRDEIAALNARYQVLATRLDNVIYVPTDGRSLDPDNPAHWAFDGVHPSRLGAERIAEQLVKQMGMHKRRF